MNSHGTRQLELTALRLMFVSIVKGPISNVIGSELSDSVFNGISLQERQTHVLVHSCV